MVEVVREHVRPLTGEIVADRAMVPVNPFMLVAIIVEETLEPAVTVSDPGLATKLKLWTV